MSKIIKVDSCLKCNYFNGVQCMLLFNSGADYDDQKVSDSSKILPNCPLEGYPENNREDTREG